MSAGFELFDHTADLGLRAWADTPGGLVEPLTRGFYAAVGDVAAAPGGSVETLSIGGADPALRWRDYLARLLLLFECDGVVLVDPRVTRLDEAGLEVVARHAPLDAAASDLAREVKAVTYHALSLVEADGRWTFTVILDI
ncbi:MAG: archease [Phycisphaerales bacterium]|nr:MAG: archease [Phycisphaerales bacterium]